jgi:AMP-polyphosphate phosphotransferase
MLLPESPLDRTAHDLGEFTTFRRVLKIDKLDMDVSMTRDEYNERIKELQLKMVKMQRKVGDYGIRLLLVFEGMDAAGKGGAIKRLIQYLDPRGYRVHSLGPAGPADIVHHYMRRFWMRLPKRGRIGIFDDYSWYGKMLMEPIEGLVSAEQLERAPEQIRDFERTVAQEDCCVIKFWLQVDREEQLQRFKRRLQNPYKSWKLSPEDWRNREMYDQYMAYAQRIFDETDAPYAPWFIVPGNDKLYARVAVLQIVTDILDAWPIQPNLFERRVTELPWLEEYDDAVVDLLDEDD